MELSFATKTLRSECLDQGRGEQAYGATVAIGLRARLADLDAAVTVVDLPPTELLRTSDREMRVALAPGWDLVCEPGGIRRHDGSRDWTRVYRLKLLKIEKL